MLQLFPLGRAKGAVRKREEQMKRTELSATMGNGNEGQPMGGEQGDHGASKRRKKGERWQTDSEYRTWADPRSAGSLKQVCLSADGDHPHDQGSPKHVAEDASVPSLRAKGRKAVASKTITGTHTTLATSAQKFDAADKASGLAASPELASLELLLSINDSGSTLMAGTKQRKGELRSWPRKIQPTRQGRRASTNTSLVEEDLLVEDPPEGFRRQARQKLQPLTMIPASMDPWLRPGRPSFASRFGASQRGQDPQASSSGMMERQQDNKQQQQQQVTGEQLRQLGLKQLEEQPQKKRKKKNQQEQEWVRQDNEEQKRETQLRQHAPVVGQQAYWTQAAAQASGSSTQGLEEDLAAMNALLRSLDASKDPSSHFRASLQTQAATGQLIPESFPPWCTAQKLQSHNPPQLGGSFQGHVGGSLQASSPYAVGTVTDYGCNIDHTPVERNPQQQVQRPNPHNTGSSDSSSNWSLHHAADRLHELHSMTRFSDSLRSVNQEGTSRNGDKSTAGLMGPDSPSDRDTSNKLSFPMLFGVRLVPSEPQEQDVQNWI